MKPKYYHFSSSLAFTHILSFQDDPIRSMFSTLITVMQSKNLLYVENFPEIFSNSSISDAAYFKAN